MRKIRISVCMATYNGERFLEKQLTSICSQLVEGDEIIISDDGSTDQTLEIIENIKKNNKNLAVNLIKGPRKGVIKNFENAISHSKNEIIILSDQDDIWHESKAKEIKKIFKKSKNITLLIHDALLINENGEIIGKRFKYRQGIIENILKNTYIGCCMAFRKNELLLPFPSNIPMHDSWIGILHEINGRVYYLEKNLMFYRIHGNNYSLNKKRCLFEKIKNRKNLILNIIKRLIRIG